jgi:hypothetical protein
MKRSQIILWAIFCMLWPLDKLLKYKPLWYTGRAVVGVFGYVVIGKPGEAFFVMKKDS